MKARVEGGLLVLWEFKLTNGGSICCNIKLFYSGPL
jgi:hypothetical protein